MWHIFWRGYSRLRSGREHWAWMVVVEVRQGTLGVDGRGWGPAGNTGRGWSWLRSGREHWAWMVVVEVRQGTLGVDGRGWGPTENTVDRESQLSRRTRRTTRGGRQREEEERRGGGGPGNWHKSNNPHLAGGEQPRFVEVFKIFSSILSKHCPNTSVRTNCLEPSSYGTLSLILLMSVIHCGGLNY